MTDPTELRRLAEAATPGPWDVYGAVVWSPDARSVIAGASATEPTSGFVEYERPKWSAINQPARNAAYIAAMHPQTTLALLDRLARAESLVADARRFRWLVKNASAHYRAGDDWYSSMIQWNSQTRTENIRAAIDAEMMERAMTDRHRPNHSRRKESIVIAAPERDWPAGCYDPTSCERHRMCMYHHCIYTELGAALGDAIDAAMKGDSNE